MLCNIPLHKWALPLMFYLLIHLYLLLSVTSEWTNIFAFQNICLAKILRTGITESKTKCFIQCYGRHWLAVCQTCLIFLLGTEIKYISQPSLQWYVHLRWNYFQRNMRRSDEMMYNTSKCGPLSPLTQCSASLFPSLLAFVEDSKASVRLFLKDCEAK